MVDGNKMLGLPCNPDQSLIEIAGSEVTKAKSYDIEHSSRPCDIPGTIRLVDAKDYASLQLSQGGSMSHAASSPRASSLRQS